MNSKNVAINNKEIQYMRAIAIILVVLQHAIVVNTDNNVAYVIASVCYSIDVKVFMFISGYLFENNYDKYRQHGNKKFIIRKFENLMIPYLFWECVLYFGAWVIYNGPNVLSRFSGVVEGLGFSRLSLSQIFVSLLTFQDSYIELYWFIYALFVIFVIQYITKWCLATKVGIVGMMLIIPFIRCFVDVYIVDKILASIILFSFGRFAKTKNFECKSIKWWMALTAGCVFFFFFFAPDLIEVIYLEQLWTMLKSAILGVCGVIIVSWLAVVVSKFSVISKCAKLIGNYSFSIYILHNPWVVKLVSLILPCRGALERAYV